jgi:Protein of unknown function (DUF2795)
VTVTRLEIADHVAPAFEHPPATRADILATAVRTHARIEVVQVLELLPEQLYPDLRSLWRHLTEIPVDA